MRFRIVSFIFLVLLTSATFATPKLYNDACASLKGAWNGNFWDLKTKCGCRTFYDVYQSGENIAIHLEIYNCTPGCAVPPDIKGVCRDGKFTSDFDGGFSGIVYDRMVDLRSEHYQMTIYKS